VVLESPVCATANRCEYELDIEEFEEWMDELAVLSSC
jgi:hypothetical protein